MSLKEFTLKVARVLYTKLFGYPSDSSIDLSRVQYFGKDANNFIYEKILKTTKYPYKITSDKRGLAICKFGTIELGCMVANRLQHKKISYDEYVNYVKGYPIPIFYNQKIRGLNNNAGVFPATVAVANKFVGLMFDCLADVDILSSYCYAERYILEEIKDAAKVDLDGFYAPFMFDNPWTRILKNKNVLVIHPFAESIKGQYSKRELLFNNPDVLPKFKSLHIIKAVQSIAGQKCEYGNWFDALESMKKQMEDIDFDIAIIGCGAYGFPLTVHAKRLGKIGIHMAGWTQMLFGIYGKRWIEDQPQYAKFINENWVRPSQNEVPFNANSVEGACYW